LMTIVKSATKMRVLSLMALICLVVPVSSAMAGTNAAKLRRPTIRRSTYHSGTLGPPHAASSLDDALAFARQSKMAFKMKRVIKHQVMVKQISDERHAFPMLTVQACIEASTNGKEVEECLLPGETEAVGWAM